MNPKIRGWLLLAAMAPSIATASAVRIPKLAELFGPRSYGPLLPVTKLTARDLGSAPKAENIKALLEIANAERRIDDLESLQAWGRFNAVPFGDVLLLKCLQDPACHAGTCGAVARASDLHAAVLTRRPALNLTQANHAVGEVSEKLMHAHFEGSGWSRIEGQVGRTGIDGLFIKRRPDGTVRDVLIVESKFNTGSLQPTNHGHQMSREWALRKLAQLQLAYPDERAYRQVSTLIERGFYRARLWTMRVGADQIHIDLQRVHSKGADIELLENQGNRIPIPPKSILLSAPADNFEQNLVNAYNSALNALGPP